MEMGWHTRTAAVGRLRRPTVASACLAPPQANQGFMCKCQLLADCILLPQSQPRGHTGHTAQAEAVVQEREAELTCNQVFRIARRDEGQDTAAQREATAPGG